MASFPLSKLLSNYDGEGCNYLNLISQQTLQIRLLAHAALLKETMNTQHSATRTAIQPSPTGREVTHALAAFRREWQKTAGGANLIEVAVPVGLVIADIVERLRLTRRERLRVLGARLNTAVSSYLKGSIRVKR